MIVINLNSNADFNIKIKLEDIWGRHFTTKNYYENFSSFIKWKYPRLRCQSFCFRKIKLIPFPYSEILCQSGNSNQQRYSHLQKWSWTEILKGWTRTIKIILLSISARKWTLEYHFQNSYFFHVPIQQKKAKKQLNGVYKNMSSSIYISV